MIWASIIFGSLSAISWFLAAVIPPSVTLAYWGEPPKNIQMRQKAGTWLNAGGALFASLAMGFQAYSTWASIS